MTEMPLTEQQACRLLRVTPETLKVYVAMHRLTASRKRTIRGPIVSYDESEVKALKRELEADEEFVRRHYTAQKNSAKPVDAEVVESETSSPGRSNGAASSIPTSAPVIDRLLLLLERLTPGERQAVPVERKLILTLSEAAAYSGLSEPKLNEAIRAGELKARKDLGRGYRIKRQDIETYVESL